MPGSVSLHVNFIDRKALSRSQLGGWFYEEDSKRLQNQVILLNQNGLYPSTGKIIITHRR